MRLFCVLPFKRFQLILRRMDELIDQVMLQMNRVHVKAAARLGINRNTLHKKLNDFNMLDKPEKLAE